MKLRVIIILLIVVAFSLCLISCGKSSIVGTWYASEDTKYIFKSDGTGSWESSGIGWDFEYSIDYDVLKIVYPADYGMYYTTEYHYTIADDVMYLRNDESAIFLTKTWRKETRVQASNQDNQAQVINQETQAQAINQTETTAETEIELLSYTQVGEKVLVGALNDGVRSLIKGDYMLPTEDPNGRTVLGVTNRGFSKTNISSVTLPNNIQMLGTEAFRECPFLYSVTFLNQDIELGEMSFYGCSRITTVKLPQNITKIPNGLFWYCSGLTEISIPDGVTFIGGNAFSDCKSLRRIEIPNSVKSIAAWAFASCTSLRNIYYDGTFEEWKEISFDSTTLTGDHDVVIHFNNGESTIFNPTK